MKKTVCALAVLGLGLAVLCPAARAQEPGKEVLKIQLPKPMFIGTPKNIRTPNLETVTGRPRGPFLVPVGTALLSAGKPVAASDKEPVIGEIAFATDGKKSGEDGYYVELGPMLQWIQIDLGKSQELSAIVCWHYHSQARVYRDVVVQVSNDKDFVSGVTTVFNNDHDNTSGLGAGKDKEYIETFDGKLFDPKGIKARYVRLYSAGNTSNDMNHYVEVEVYGLPAK
ncbi:MAG TPA: discoidin domain-containing protein [Candidatus Aminicenantes bacterium]|nr:discoidin domain-containing protein [Candidatus Aminicenantes bacterium]HRY63721.1 discoidin domain-containing protein [Candidatus Aminicenantes bacterium]HRZ70634.1 discoidin domain-containing protein [Candidatus Aminicenantes bacterium]